MNNILTHCRRVLAVAPELDCQVLPATALPMGVAPEGAWQGFAVPVVTPAIQQALGLPTLKPAIVLNIAAIRAASPIDDRGLLTSVVLHEAAHCLPVETDRSRPPLPADPETFAVEVRHRLTNPTPPGEAKAEYESHDAAWCRRALHLWCRAEAAGFPSPVNELFGYIQLPPPGKLPPHGCRRSARHAGLDVCQNRMHPQPPRSALAS